MAEEMMETKTIAMVFITAFLIIFVAIYGMIINKNAQVPIKFCENNNGTWINNITCAGEDCPRCESFCLYPNKTIKCIEDKKYE